MSLRGRPIHASGGPARAAARRLQRLPNVTHVTVGEKIASGEGTGLRALKVHVTKKEAIGGRGRIPRTLTEIDRNGSRHHFLTDVIETGARPSAFGMRSGHRVRAFDDDLGVAGLTFLKGANAYVLTNAHVACDVAKGGAAGPAGWYNPATHHTTPLGNIVASSPLRPDRPVTIDAAAIGVGNSGLLDPRMILGADQPISKMEMLRSNVTAYYLAVDGKFLRCIEPEPIAGDAVLEVDGVLLTYRRFWQLRSVDNAAAKGLSGAALLRNDATAIAAAGLVFGGIPDSYIWAFSFKPLFQAVFEHLPG